MDNTPAFTDLDLKRWGNSLGLRIPGVIARRTGLKVDQRVRLTVEAGRVVLTPVSPEMPTLEQRLAAFDPALHGGEAMAHAPLGRERW